MSNKRLIAMLSAVILLVAGAFTIRAGTAPAPGAPVQVKAADPAVDRHLPGKEQDDLAPVRVPIDRHLPGKEQDDLVTVGRPGDPTNVWHTPPYQGYTPSNPVPADPPGVWHTPPYQGYTP